MGIVGGWIAWHVGVLLHAAPADPDRVALEWRAPEGCPDAAFVQALVRDTIGAAPTGDAGPIGDAAPLRMRGEIDRVDDHHRLRVWFDDDPAPRELEHPDCVELARTAAFLAAIAIDPRMLDASLRDVPPPPAIAPGPDPGPEVAPQQVPSPIAAAEPGPDSFAPARRALPPTARRSTIAAAGHAVAGFGVGPSPRLTAVVGIGIGILGRAWRVEVEAHEWTPRRLDSKRNPNVGLVAQLWSVGVRGCGVLARGRLDVLLCGLAQSGLVHAKGVGALVAQRARAPWLGLGGGAGVVGWIVPRFGLGCAADLLWVAIHGGFRSEPSGDIDRVGQVAFATTCGVHWRHRAPAKLETRRAGQVRR